MPTSNNSREYFAIQNKDIDFVTIKFKSNLSFPTTNCKVLKLNFGAFDKASVLDSFEKFIKDLDTSVKVDLKLKFCNYCIKTAPLRFPFKLRILNMKL